MNAFVTLGTNSAGLQTASPLKRAQAATSVGSLGFADLLARLRAGKASDEEAAAWSASPIATKMKMASTKEASSSDSSSSSSSSTSSTSLDRDAFLNLFVTELQYQDPLAPTDTSDMMAQLAQLGTLEQLENLANSVNTVSGNIDQLNFMSAAAMLGKTITGVDSSGKAVEGVVDGIGMDGSVVYLTVGDKTVSMAGVYTINTES